MIIKRARGHRLYTTDGKKILDLSMDQGRAVLGHRPNGLSLAIKNVIDRGLFSSFDNVYENRLKKDLNKRFPNHPFVTILKHEDKVSGLMNATILDPLFDNTDNEKISYWRPFLQTPNCEHLIILYPVPGLNMTTILISKEDQGFKSDRISPILLSGILKSLYEYDQILKDFKVEKYSAFSKINKTTFLPPYLVFNRDKKSYEELVHIAMENDVLLNDQFGFAILPPDFSSGEQKKILDLFN